MRRGDRIAQLVVAPVVAGRVSNVVDELDESGARAAASAVPAVAMRRSRVNVYVVGAGAVGTYLGELLRGTGARSPTRRAQLDDVTPVEADLAIVAVKAYDTDGAIETLRRALRAPADDDDPLPAERRRQRGEARRGVRRRRDRRGALTVPVDRTRDGRSVATHDGGMGSRRSVTSAHNWLIAAFEKTGLPIKVVADYRALKWSKLVAQHRRQRVVRDPQRLARAARAFGRRCSRWRFARCARCAP